MSFTANLKTLPGVSHLAAIQLMDPTGEVVAMIENKPGQAAYLAVYNHLGQIYGAITGEAAKKGLDLFSEQSAEARANPGKFPNIDRLIVLAEQGGMLRLKHIFATGVMDNVVRSSTAPRSDVS